MISISPRGRLAAAGMVVLLLIACTGCSSGYTDQSTKDHEPRMLERPVRKSGSVRVVGLIPGGADWMGGALSGELLVPVQGGLWLSEVYELDIPTGARLVASDGSTSTLVPRGSDEPGLGPGVYEVSGNMVSIDQVTPARLKWVSKTAPRIQPQAGATSEPVPRVKGVDARRLTGRIVPVGEPSQSTGVGVLAVGIPSNSPRIGCRSCCSTPSMTARPR